ncbi:chromosomal replication initiation protein [Richelia intracellularis HH01]|uniref:Chromosomal replication initiation protein n=1 Tax=Richelia intracellularis HH01 TaxID=1165094 RepID=M1WY08_9NOST|nr:chromosomal replication initiation protein [Richelia intracellularis HH01]
MSWALQIAMSLMRKHADFSLPRIGDKFGRKYHINMYSYDKITQLKETDPSLAVILRQLNDCLTMTKHPKK